MDNIDIRNADITDLDSIVFVESNCFPKEVMATKEMFKKRLEAYPENFFVGYVNSEIVGIVNGCVTNQKTITDDLYDDVTTNIKNGNYQVVFGLAVLPKYQGKGIASSLLKHYENYAKTNNRNGVILTCKEELISFYQKRGYKNLGVSESVHGSKVWYDMILENLK